MKRWIGIRFELPPGREEALGVLLDLAGGLSAHLEDGAGGLRCELALERPEQVERFQQTYARHAVELGLPPAPRGWVEHPIERRDWHESWARAWPPQRVAGFLILAPWHRERPAEHELPLRLIPGRAFGTGYHQTTRMCLELLREHLRARDALLDLGTGSGILALAAVRLGARAIGVDCDPEAVASARENARLNRIRLGPELDFRPLDAAAQIAPAAAFDVVTANLDLATLDRLGTGLLEPLRAGGRLIISGLLSEQLPGALARLAGRGTAVLASRQAGEWAAAALQRE